MISLTIEFVTDSNKLLEDIFNKSLDEIRDGDSIKINDRHECTVTLEEYSPSESFGLVECITIGVTFASAVFGPLLADWIKSLLKKDKEKGNGLTSIKIDGIVIKSKDIEVEINQICLNKQNQK